MENDSYDDYPLLDFMFDNGLGQGGIYAEDQVVLGTDGPEICSFETPWDNGDDDDDDTWIMEPPVEEEEFYYEVDERELSSCHEEWEDYC